MMSKVSIKTLTHYTFICGLALCLISCGSWSKTNIRNMVPNEIVITKVLTVEWDGSFDESEGFGLYEISNVTSKEITERGVSFFAEIKTGKTPKWTYTDKWITHKAPLDFSWIKSTRTQRLFDQDKWSDEKIYTIYSNRTNHAGGIIIIPEINLINVYYES